MVDIAVGMTMDQVVEILGPPTDRMDAAELTAGSWVSGSGAARAATSDEQYWLYKDVPGPGQIMNIAFEHGVVTVVQGQSAGR